MDTTVQFRGRTWSRDTDWRSWWPLTMAARGREVWSRRGWWSRGNNWSKLARNTGGTRTGMTKQQGIIWTLCWVKTAGGLKREMEGDSWVSGEPEATGGRDYEGNAAISAGCPKIPCSRWKTLPEEKNQWTAGQGVSEHGAEKKCNASGTPTERALWKKRKDKKGSRAVLVAGNVCRRQRLGENVWAVREESASTG